MIANSSMRKAQPTDTKARPRASLQPVTRLLKKRSPELLMVPEPEVCLSPE
jgi:hypothetical protein